MVEKKMVLLVGVFVFLFTVTSVLATDIQLNYTYDSDDTYADEQYPNSDTSSYAVMRVMNATSSICRSYIKWNITIIPSGQLITNAMLGLRQELYYDGNISVFQVYNQSWTEKYLRWGNQPCGTDFDNSSQCNLTKDITFKTQTGWNWINVTGIVSREYNAGRKNVTFVLVKWDKANSSQAEDYYTKERSGDNKPYLNISYMAIPTTTTTSTTTSTTTTTIPIPQSFNYCLDQYTLVTIKTVSINILETNTTRSFNVTENVYCIWGCDFAGRNCYPEPFWVHTLAMGIILALTWFAYWIYKKLRG